MNRDDIIRMAREAGIRLSKDVWPWEGEAEEALERFAALVEQHLIESGYRKCAEGQRTTQFCGQLEAAVAAEREACARVCEERGMVKGGEVFAARIRARGEQSVGKSEQVPTVCDDYLEKCPNCNGPADNGFDRSWPDPNPYFCKKCMKEME